MSRRDNRSKPAVTSVTEPVDLAAPAGLVDIEIPGRESLDIRVAPVATWHIDEPDRQRFIDAAAIRFHLPGVPAAKAFRLADELWTAREAYLRERAKK